MINPLKVDNNITLAIWRPAWRVDLKTSMFETSPSTAATASQASQTPIGARRSIGFSIMGRLMMAEMMPNTTDSHQIKS